MTRPPWCTPARRTGRSPTSCSTAATSPARASPSPRRSPRGSRPGPTSTPTAPPTGPAMMSSCAAWCARSSTASTPTSPARPTPSRSTTAAAGSSSIGRLKLSEFGTFHETISLDEGAPVGSYRIRLWQPGKSEFAGAFEVQAYQLQKIDLAFDLPRTVYYRGEPIKGSLVARYQYGTPLANRAIALQLPDGRTLQGQTDAAGKYAFELETTGFSEEQALRLVAQLPQDNVGVAAAVMIAVRAFRIDLSTEPRRLPRRRELRPPRHHARRPGRADRPGALGRRPEAACERNGQVSEREASRQELATDKKTGKGEVRLKVEDDEGGSYVIRAAGTDRFGNPVIAERLLTISGKKDETKLRILTDRTTFKVGEAAEVRVVNRGPAGTALADLGGRPDPVVQDRPHRRRATMPWPGRSTGRSSRTSRSPPRGWPPRHSTRRRLDVRVERDLRVTLTPRAPSRRPGRRGRGRGHARPTRMASRWRPSCRSRWSIARCSGSSATGCRRSTGSSTTSRGPRRSPRSRARRSATSPRRCRCPRRRRGRGAAGGAARRRAGPRRGDEVAPGCGRLSRP